MRSLREEIELARQVQTDIERALAASQRQTVLSLVAAALGLIAAVLFWMAY